MRTILQTHPKHDNRKPKLSTLRKQKASKPIVSSNSFFAKRVHLPDPTNVSKLILSQRRLVFWYPLPNGKCSWNAFAEVAINNETTDKDGTINAHRILKDASDIFFDIVVRGIRSLSIKKPRANMLHAIRPRNSELGAHLLAVEEASVRRNASRGATWKLRVCIENVSNANPCRALRQPTSGGRAGKQKLESITDLRLCRMTTICSR